MSRRFGFVKWSYTSGGYDHKMTLSLAEFATTAPYHYATPPASGNVSPQTTMDSIVTSLQNILGGAIGPWDLYQDNGIGVPATFITSSTSLPSTGPHGTDSLSAYVSLSWKGNGRHGCKLYIEGATFGIGVPAKIRGLSGLPSGLAAFVNDISVADEIVCADGRGKHPFLNAVFSYSKHFRKVSGER
jgi:hypothetical protein